MSEHFSINTNEGKWFMMGRLPEATDMEQAYYIDKFYDIIKRSVGDTVELHVEVKTASPE